MYKLLNNCVEISKNYGKTILRNILKKFSKHLAQIMSRASELYQEHVVLMSIQI